MTWSIESSLAHDGDELEWLKKKIHQQGFTQLINRLVGGFHPISEIGNLPQIGVKIKNMWKHRSCRTHRIWNHHLAGLGSLCSYDQKNTIWGEENLVLSKRCWNHHHLNWYRLILGGTKIPKICYGLFRWPKRNGSLGFSSLWIEYLNLKKSNQRSFSAKFRTS